MAEASDPEHKLEVKVTNQAEVIAGGNALVTGSCRCGWKWPLPPTSRESEVRDAWERAHPALAGGGRG